MAENANAGNDEHAKTFRPNIPTPSPLEINSRNLEKSWRKFKRQWNNYEVASRLDKENKSYRKSVFLAVIGEDAFDTFEGFSFTDQEDQDDINVVIAKFEAYCIGESNEIYETFIFNQRNQEEGESIDAYVTALRKLAKTCNFGDMEDRMLRDRLVIGVRDEVMRQKLLADRKLILSSCIELCRAHESSHSQAKAITSGGTEAVDFVNRKSMKTGENKPQTSKKCKQCGCFHQLKEKCRAKDAECFRCHKKGHFSAVCYSRTQEGPRMPHSQEVHSVSGGQGDFLGTVGMTVNESEPSLHLKDLCMPHSEVSGGQDLFLGAVSGFEEAWHANVQVEGRTVKFKLDTGADVTVVPERCVSKKTVLQVPKKKLFGPAQSQLNVKGMFSAVVEYKGVKSTQEIYVVEKLQQPLLGRPALQALQLVKRVDTLETGKSAKNEKEAHPKLFTGLGKVRETYTIRLKENAVPYAVSAPRRVPLPMQQRVQEELKRLQNLEVIRPVTTPTDWCAPIVVVPKDNSAAIRLCVDLTKLNESVRRENYPLPSTDQLLAQLADATVFSKLDCNSGFHQIPLDETSQELTTFITPFGRFCYTRLPFGISSGPEVFHRMMSQLLADIQGVICDIDDILVSGRCQDEHNQRLSEVLKRLEAAGVTLNDKCVFRQSSVRFLGHIVSKEGIRMDPAKVEAIKSFPRPACVPELRRLLGMINFVQKFAPDLADVTRPLRELLKKEVQWIWGDMQERAFSKLKEKMSSPPVLAHYSSDRPTMVSADSSSYGLGAVLLQEQKKGEWQPVFFASRSLTTTEQRYAQVEKEALACTWACEKFSDFLLGLPSFTIETDHRPLLALLKTKGLDELPPRIQRFRMRLMRYSYQVMYTAGKNLTTADALSRAPTGSPEKGDQLLESDTRAFVASVIDSIPATPRRLEEIKRKQQEDKVCSRVMQYCREGWPTDKAKMDAELRPFYQVRYDLTVQEGLLLFDTRLVIPAELRKDILGRIHEGHQGIVKCRALAKSSVWWPGLSQQVQTLVENCGTCDKERHNRPEPLKPSSVPDYPWQRVGMDLFDWQGQQYLLVVDYFSRNIELAHLRNSTSSETVINHCKSIFARHGIPEVVHSDNGPQFAARVFAQFAEKYGFIHTTSSPHHPEGNGEAERAVQTVKNFLSKAEDPYLALLQYRATPLQCGFSPAEMSMGRRLRTIVPVVSSSLIPDWPKLQDIKSAETAQKEAQKKNFDRHHKATVLPALLPGEKVWVKEPKESEAVVVKPLSPRSYEVQTPGGRLRRNRRHLNRRSGETTPPKKINLAVPSTLPTPAETPLRLDLAPVPVSVQLPQNAKQGISQPSERESAPKTETFLTTRSGRISKPPVRMDL